MEVKASLNHLRISPRKVRLVVDLVRGLETKKALSQLKFNAKNASGPIAKLLQSAIANAVNNFELDENNLYIKEIRVDEGRTLKRWMPRAHGRATTIRKRSSHISLVLAEIKESGKKGPKKVKVDAPVKLGKAKEVKEDSTKAKKEVPQDTSQADSGEKGTEINDPRREGHGTHTKIEGKNQKSFSKNMFRRKSA